nr:hypothetical protein [Saprospiraceae bacterium]
MKYLFSVLIVFFLAGTTFNPANATPSIEIEEEKVEMINFMELLADYECTYTVTFEVGVNTLVGGSMEVECTGTGTSDNSASEACNRAYEAIRECITFWNNME